MENPSLEQKFTADVDRLLHGEESEEGISVPGDYSQMLNTARELAALDLSPQSRIRTSLRRRLMDELAARKAWSMPKGKVLPSWFSKRTVQLASVLMIIAGITLFVELSFRGVVHSLCGRILEFVQIGVPTYAVQKVPGGSEGSSQYPTPGANEDSVAYWDMRWEYITLFGTMGTPQDSPIGRGTK
ncbi:MAG: hypothetical protein ABSC61_02795 [Anaerolineales bacterium]